MCISTIPTPLTGTLKATNHGDSVFASSLFLILTLKRHKCRCSLFVYSSEMSDVSKYAPATMNVVEIEWDHWSIRVYKSHFISGYYIQFNSEKRLKISVKWASTYDYYKSAKGWVEDQWTHLVFTWAAGKGIRAYLNGCDMDADDSRGYAYNKTRDTDISKSLSFRLGKPEKGRVSAIGVVMDELCIWYEQLNAHQIWQFYVRGGTMHYEWFNIDLDDDNTSTLNKSNLWYGSLDPQKTQIWAY